MIGAVDAGVHALHGSRGGGTGASWLRASARITLNGRFRTNGLSFSFDHLSHFFTRAAAGQHIPDQRTMFLPFGYTGMLPLTSNGSGVWLQQSGSRHRNNDVQSLVEHQPGMQAASCYTLPTMEPRGALSCSSSGLI